METSSTAGRTVSMMRGMVRAVYTAAHAEFPDTEPLGGGKAVADFLIREWRATTPFDLTVLSPRAVNALPAAGSLAGLGERAYARFCRAFEHATTTAILAHDPTQTVILANDISEGPDFRALGERGYRITTIFHVDVVEYFTKFYLRGWIAPERLTRWTADRWLPDLLQLVFQKQRHAVQHSARLIVPSPPMKELLLRCYPFCPAERIMILPWGNLAAPAANGARLPYPDDEFIILTLSRLSPEKGIERLLAALPAVRGKCRVLICGAAAYMRGRKYERQLRRQASAIAHLPVEFLGHVTGPRKTALLRRADLFVSPSRHESYGLTIAEAQAAGCPVLSHPHYGATGTVVDCGDPAGLAATLDRLIAAGRARAPVSPPAPVTAAAELAELLQRGS